MGDVVILDGETRLDIPADRVLDGAQGQLERVILIGKDKHGKSYHASSFSSIGDMLLMIERFKEDLLQQ